MRHYRLHRVDTPFKLPKRLDKRNGWYNKEIPAGSILLETWWVHSPGSETVHTLQLLYTSSWARADYFEPFLANNTTLVQLEQLDQRSQAFVLGNLFTYRADTLIHHLLNAGVVTPQQIVEALNTEIPCDLTSSTS